jgi:AraC family transcriptional regulator
MTGKMVFAAGASSAIDPANAVRHARRRTGYSTVGFRSILDNRSVSDAKDHMRVEKFGAVGTGETPGWNADPVVDRQDRGRPIARQAGYRRDAVDVSGFNQIRLNGNCEQQFNPQVVRPIVAVATLNGPSGEVSLSSVLVSFIADAVAALDYDHDVARRLLRRAAALLQSNVARRGLTMRARAKAALAPWQAKRVASHIKCNLDRPLLLDELASVVQLSNSYFSRAFKGTFGQTPHAYIIHRRVERARYEMLAGREPLAQIALSCGFADQAHLARMFRRETGLAPSEWRRVNGPAIACSGKTDIMIGRRS